MEFGVRKPDLAVQRALWGIDAEGGRPLPASVPSFHLEARCGPGTGWRLRRRVRGVSEQLEREGFVVTTCLVGRAYKLQRRGVLPPAQEGEQDRLGLAAVIDAHRPGQEDGWPETGGVREPRRPAPHAGSGAEEAAGERERS